jgi:hypothetical protein
MFLPENPNFQIIQPHEGNLWLKVSRKSLVLNLSQFLELISEIARNCGNP